MSCYVTLKEKGLKLTPQRTAILDAVYATHDHFDADELYLGLRADGQRISKATVYRTLDLLTAAGLIREVDLDKGHRAYEHVLGHGHHDHLLCTSCGKVIEFDDAEIEDHQNRVCSEFGFRPESHSLRIRGICADCQRT